MEGRRVSGGTTARQPLDHALSPSTRYLPSGSTLGKRGAAEAHLDSMEPSLIRKQLSSSTSAMSHSVLQRRYVEMEAKSRETERELEEVKMERGRLKGERCVLYEGEAHERQVGEDREKEWSEERMGLNAQLTEFRNSNSVLKDTVEQLRHEYNQLNNQHGVLTINSKAEMTTLTARIDEVVSERDRLKGWERRAAGLSIELEEEKRKAEEGRRGQDDEKDNAKLDVIMRDELKRQATHLVTLQRDHAILKNEVVDLRQKKKEADAMERAAKDVERVLRDEIRMLQEQLERSRRDMDSLTQPFPSASSSPAEDASTLQQRLQTLSSLHSQATTEIAMKDNEIRSLESRLSTVSQSSASTILVCTRRAEEAERELRWAKEGRLSAERREQLAKKEIASLRPSEDQSMPGGMISEDQSGRIRQLENLVETYKNELEGISRDSRDLEDKLTHGAGLVKQSALEEAQERIAQLERDIDSFDSTISALTSANTTLDAEVNDLMRRVASGEYNPAVERCIELRDNPASRVQAIRTRQLEDLKNENEALLERLKSVDRQPTGEDDGMGLVPRESWERLRLEKEEMEKAHAKRLLRLKEIFGNKSKEFLEAVYSLLGWRIKFDESGADIRLTSMYAPKGKMGLTLKFASQEGHFGTMQMTGAMAKGLEDTRHFWIVERQSVPGFLAQVTTEMFEKTTIGRAAGYVGLE